MSGGEGMIVRNGIRSTLRARGRAALFTLLILVLTLSLTLGLGMWVYCAQTLAAVDESYTSIALVEYMGQSYPDQDTADEEARRAAGTLDGAAVSAIEGVELWESTDSCLAAAAGYERTEGLIPYEDYGVVTAFNFSPLTREEWVTVTVEEPEVYPCLVSNAATFEVSYCLSAGERVQVPTYLLTETGFRLFTLKDGEVIFRSGELDYLSNDESYVVYEMLQGTGLLYYLGTYVPGYNAHEWMSYTYIPMTDEYRYYVYETVTYGYQGIISSALYTREGKAGILAVFEPGDTGFVPEEGKRYLLHGVFTQGNTANRQFTVTEFYEGCDTAPYLELSGSGDPALEEGIFADYAEKYRRANNYLRMEASGDIAALEPFHQGALYLAQGRFPEPGETGVCVVDGRTAAQMELALGDGVEVEKLLSGEDSRFDLSLSGETRTLEVVGITNAVEEYAGYLWVAPEDGGGEQTLFGYTLGRAVLDNALGRQAADALQAMAPEGVRVTLYDQGYSTAAQPLKAMESTALALTAASACGTLAVLLLFAYLFVGRQRETVEILSCLGTPAGKIRLWLLSGAAMVAGTAAAAGGAAGALSLGAILRAALTSAQQLYSVDQRYSEAAVGVAREAPALGDIPRWPAAAAALAVCVLALLLCLFFLRLTRRQDTPRKGKNSVRVPREGTSTAGRGAPRFALLAARRGGWRTGVVPAAALALALLLGLLVSGARGWSGQIDALYDTARITGQVTSTNGRQATSVALSVPNARLLWDSGLLSQLSVSKGWHYWFWDEMPEFSNTTFGEDTRAAWIGRQPQLVALNSLDAAPAFYYGEAPQVEWLEGWDEGFLSATDYYSVLNSISFFNRYTEVGGEEWLTYPCLVSRELLEERGLSLGDTFQLSARLDQVIYEDYDASLELQIVGAYAGTAGQSEIYVPLSFWLDPRWLTGEVDPAPGEGERVTSAFADEAGRDAYFYTYTTLSTCRFTLASPRELDALRDYLAGQGISQVNRMGNNRTTVVIRDQAFVETVGGLGRYVTFSRILLPALCAAVGLLGFIISWLMVSSRRVEFAILRGLGASRGRVFATFFLEQGGLALLGCLAGGGALTLLGAGWAGWAAAAGFLACYLAGCALAVALAGRTNLMSLLSERE